MSPERITDQKEVETKEAGYVIVITGKTGAGKDTVIEKLREQIDLQMVVSYADRPKRDNEIEGVHHHFVTREHLQQIAKEGGLVERLDPYGTTNKATPKSQLMKVVSGHTIWRIDPRKALEVARGEFFDQFSEEESLIFNRSRFVVIFINAPNNELYDRWEKRDGESFNINEYEPRLALDDDCLAEGADIYDYIIENPDGQLMQTVETVLRIINNL